MMKDNVILSLKNVTKEYYGVKALDNVSFDIRRGEIHGLVGENGAGKSTLIKSIAGAIEMTKGSIYFNSELMSLKSPAEAIEKGIGVVYQEFNLFPNLTVYENIFFGIEIKKNNILDRPKMIEKAKELVKELGFDFDVEVKVKSLSTAFQQITEIAKCINHNVELIIMDEPSAPLTENEVDEMFKVVKKLNDRGVTIIYISHKLNEILELSNRISILRDGKYITTINKEDANEKLLIKHMVGREIEEKHPTKKYNDGEVILQCEHLQGDKVKDVSFNLKKGEVLGFGGLVGAGRTETVRLLFGADKKNAGKIIVNGKEVKINSPTDAINSKIGLIPEDRKSQGLILNKSIFLNCLLPSLKTYSKGITGRINFKHAHEDVAKLFDLLKVKAQNQEQLVRNLSGGNQQKVVLEKWMLKDCDILILDEPTRGIDVGAKQEIYQLIHDLSEKGKSIIVISSEMPELIRVSHRVLVMHEGEITGELTGDDINQEAIMSLAS